MMRYVGPLAEVDADLSKKIWGVSCCIMELTEKEVKVLGKLLLSLGGYRNYVNDVSIRSNFKAVIDQLIERLFMEEVGLTDSEAKVFEEKLKRILEEGEE